MAITAGDRDCFGRTADVGFAIANIMLKLKSVIIITLSFVLSKYADSHHGGMVRPCPVNTALSFYIGDTSDRCRFYWCLRGHVIGVKHCGFGVGVPYGFASHDNPCVIHTLRCSQQPVTRKRTTLRLTTTKSTSTSTMTPMTTTTTRKPTTKQLTTTVTTKPPSTTTTSLPPTFMTTTHARTAAKTSIPSSTTRTTASTTNLPPQGTIPNVIAFSNSYVAGGYFIPSRENLNDCIRSCVSAAPACQAVEFTSETKQCFFHPPDTACKPLTDKQGTIHIKLQACE